MTIDTIGTLNQFEYRTKESIFKIAGIVRRRARTECMMFTIFLLLRLRLLNQKTNKDSFWYT